MDFSSEGITNYYTWIEKWHNHLEGAPTSIKVPTQASLIHTPLIIHSWRKALSLHPNQPLVEFFLKGISQGFRIGFNHLPNGLKPARKNLAGALQHPQVVEEYLSAEFLHHRVAGPFTKDLPFVHINRFGVIPKHHQPNKWRLIADLSYPDHHSINAGIPKSLCGLFYITIDNTIQKILELGPNTLLAKIDIKMPSVYCQSTQLIATYSAWNGISIFTLTPASHLVAASPQVVQYLSRPSSMDS